MLSLTQAQFRAKTSAYWKNSCIVNYMKHLLLCLFVLASSSFCKAEILHLELAAGNYAPPLLMPAWSEGAKLRLQVLEYVLDELIHRHGKEGVIYLNDVNIRSLRVAGRRLRFMLMRRGLWKIKVRLLHGDFNLITIPQVKTMNLMNPEVGMLPTLGHSPNKPAQIVHAAITHRSNPKSQREFNLAVTEDLYRLARHSETGLFINSYFVDSLRGLDLRLSPEFELLELDGSLRYFDTRGNQPEAWTDPIQVTLRVKRISEKLTPLVCMSFL